MIVQLKTQFYPFSDCTIFIDFFYVKLEQCFVLKMIKLFLLQFV